MFDITVHTGPNFCQFPAQIVQFLPGSGNDGQFVGRKAVAPFKFFFYKNFLQCGFGPFYLFENFVFPGSENAQIIFTQLFKPFKTANFAGTAAQIDQNVVTGQIIQRIKHKVGIVIQRNEIIVFQNGAAAAPERIVNKIGIRNRNHFKRIPLILFHQQRRQKL